PAAAARTHAEPFSAAPRHTRVSIALGPGSRTDPVHARHLLGGRRENRAIRSRAADPHPRELDLTNALRMATRAGLAADRHLDWLGRLLGRKRRRPGGDDPVGAREGNPHPAQAARLEPRRLVGDDRDEVGGGLGHVVSIVPPVHPPLRGPCRALPYRGARGGDGAGRNRAARARVALLDRGSSNPFPWSAGLLR